MADGFAETFQDKKKPGRTLLQSGAGLLQTRRPNKSEDVSDLGGRLVRSFLTGFMNCIGTCGVYTLGWAVLNDFQHLHKQLCKVGFVKSSSLNKS